MVKWPEKVYGKYSDQEFNQGWNLCHDAFMKVINTDNFEKDISIHGVCIEKDGKRIDPKDFYKPSYKKVLDLEGFPKAKPNTYKQDFNGELQSEKCGYNQAREEIGNLECPSHKVLSLEDIEEILKPIPSTAYPIFKLNDKKYHYICKEDIAKSIHEKMKG